METKPRIIGTAGRYLSRCAERVVELLTPPRRRDEVIGDLYKESASAPQFLRSAGSIVPEIIADEVRRTFNRRIISGQACILYICFASASLTAPVLPICIVIGLALSFAAISDAYRNPDKPVYGQIAAHSTAAAALIVTAEVAAALWAPSFTADLSALAPGIISGVLLISVYRFLLGCGRPSRPKCESLFLFSIVVPLAAAIGDSLTAAGSAATAWLAWTTLAATLSAAAYVAQTIRYSSGIP